MGRPVGDNPAKRPWWVPRSTRRAATLGPSVTNRSIEIRRSGNAANHAEASARNPVRSEPMPWPRNASSRNPTASSTR